MYELTTASGKEDLEQVTSLVARTFTNKGYWFFVDMRNGIHKKDPFFKPEHSHIVKYKGEVVSHIGIITKPMRLHGEKFVAGGIGDVVTHRQHRGKGLASRLMKQVVQFMQDNEYDFSILSGIPNYYHRFGYIETLPVYRADIETKYLKDIKSTYRIFPFQEGKHTLVSEIYNDNFSRIQCSVIRPENYYYREHLDKETILVYDENNNCKGYAVLWDTYETGFIIKEAGVLDHESFKAIVSYCFQRLQELSMDKMIVQMPPQTPFIEYLKDLHLNLQWSFPREKEGGKMGRFIQFYPLFKRLRSYYEKQLHHSPWQEDNFLFLIKTELGDVGFDYTNRSLKILSSTGKKPDMTLEIGADLLFRFFTGYWNIQRFEARARVSLDKKVAQLLQVLFPEKISFFSAVDYF